MAHSPSEIIPIINTTLKPDSSKLCVSFQYYTTFSKVKHCLGIYDTSNKGIRCEDKTFSPSS